MTDDNVARGLAAACSKVLGGIAKGAQAWAITSRQVITSFPVPCIRPATANTVCALDVMPNGSPSAYFNQIAWIDVVDTDCLVGNPYLSTARVGVTPTAVEFGSYGFNGANPKPVHLTLGGNYYLTLGLTGNISMPLPILRPGYLYSQPTTGQTVVIAQTQDVAIIDPAGSLATLTVQLPTASATYDGQIVSFSSTQAVAALTVTATAGTVVGAPTSLSAGQGVSYICVGSTATWYRLS